MVPREQSIANTVCAHMCAHTHTHTQPLSVGTSVWGAEAASCLSCDFTGEETHSEKNHLLQTPQWWQHWDLTFGQSKACALCGLLHPPLGLWFLNAPGVC